jgi:hypothetical protein
VADHNPFIDKESAMKMTKWGKALFAALCAASPVLAADSALPALVGPATRENFNKQKVKAKLLALDSELDPQRIDNVIDALLDVEQEPKPIESPMAAVDESPADKLRKLLAGKVDDATINEACALLEGPVVADETPEPKPQNEPSVSSTKPDEVKAAMDSLRRELREAEEAKRDVRSVVGDVIGMDSANDVYGFALDHLKIDRDGINDVKALRALFKIASSKSPSAPRIAQDSAGLYEKFPQVARFRNA